MLNGIYRAAMGMRGELDIQDTLANNIANAGTVAFKRHIPTFADVMAGGPPPTGRPATVPQAAAGVSLRPAGVTIVDNRAYVSLSYNRAEANFDPAPGEVRHTGQDLDMALTGDGYFTLQTASGQQLYTRAGDFVLDADQDLATSQGYKVLGEQGAIHIGQGAVSVSAEGDVSVDGEVRGRLLISELSNLDQAEELDGGTFRSRSAVPASAVSVRQGFLEQSNVNAVEEMVAMIASLRAYEAAQRAVMAGDSLLGKAVNDVGRV
ncbi:MAG: flagellar hook-basal body protein [Armatimonadetes bacterium]|nr:flagellar hook-basal body protein [Armatimonadota bacterium]